MPADNELDPRSIAGWNEQARPLPPPSGTFELITKQSPPPQDPASVAFSLAVPWPPSPPRCGGRGAPGPLGMSRLQAWPDPRPPAGSMATMGARPRPARRPVRVTSPRRKAAAASRASSGTPTRRGLLAKQHEPAARRRTAAGYRCQPDFQPAYSVTSGTHMTHAWVIGQAGTPGQCADANPYICTSIVRTDDAGQTWEGGPAPKAGAPSGAAGVSGIRFLDGVNGWAFGPQLWVTHDSGNHWYPVPAAEGYRVTDLETVNHRAYALFAAQCSGPGAAAGADFAADCSHYTLMTTTAGSDDWQPVGGATSGMTAGGAATSGVLALTDARGYLVAPDGALYSGPIGGQWTKAGTVGCQAGASCRRAGLPAASAVRAGPARPRSRRPARRRHADGGAQGSAASTDSRQDPTPVTAAACWRLVGRDAATIRRPRSPRRRQGRLAARRAPGDRPPSRGRDDTGSTSGASGTVRSTPGRLHLRGHDRQRPGGRHPRGRGAARGLDDGRRR